MFHVINVLVRCPVKYFHNGSLFFNFFPIFCAARANLMRQSFSSICAMFSFGLYSTFNSLKEVSMCNIWLYNVIWSPDIVNSQNRSNNLLFSKNHRVCLKGRHTHTNRVRRSDQRHRLWGKLIFYPSDRYFLLKYKDPPGKRPRIFVA